MLTLQALALRQSRWLVLETLALETIQEGQSKFSTQLIKPHYLVNLPNDAAPQFIQKLTPFRQTDRQTARQMTGWKNGQTHRWKKGNEDEQIILQSMAPMKSHCHHQ